MKSTPAGKVGMLRDRPVFIGVASGGVFSGKRANQPDFLTPYLSLVLNSIGLKTLQFLPLQATAFLDRDQAASAREKALAAIDLTVMEEHGKMADGAIASADELDEVMELLAMKRPPLSPGHPIRRTSRKTSGR